jgi:hypothetical protein
VWPYPEPVFECPERWSAPVRASTGRVRAYDESSPDDRYYMLAAGYGATGHGAAPSERPGAQRRMAMAMIDMGLSPLVRVASRMRRRMKDMRTRVRLGGPIQRILERLLPGNG